MTATVVSDTVVKVSDPGNPQMDGWFVYQPNSLRRDVEFDYHPPARPIKDQRLKFLNERVNHSKFSAWPENV